MGTLVNLEERRAQAEFARQRALDKDLTAAITAAEEAEKAEDWPTAAAQWHHAQMLLPANACTRHGIYSKRETVARGKVRLGELMGDGK